MDEEKMLEIVETVLEEERGILRMMLSEERNAFRTIIREERAVTRQIIQEELIPVCEKLGVDTELTTQRYFDRLARLERNFTDLYLKFYEHVNR